MRIEAKTIEIKGFGSHQPVFQVRPIEDEIKQVADKAREVAKSRHHIGKEWKFTAQEKDRLRQYYYATKLLVDCLYSEGCMINPEIRQKIEETLLLPQPQ